MSDGYHFANEFLRMHPPEDPLPQPQLFTATITAVSYPTAKIRPTNAATAGDQLIGLCLGVMPKVNARVVCAWIGGEPIILGTIAPPAASTATREFDFPITVNNNAWGLEPFGQNSADTASSSDTSNYVGNFSGGLTLPAHGTFRVWVFTWQLVSHTSEAGNVRVVTRINASTGAFRNANVNITTTRTPVPSRHTLGGLAGGSAVTFDGLYRPNASGSATAGGGDGFAIYARE